MSAKKVLLVFKDGEEQRIPLEKEKILIGRDKACDVVLAHSSISRRHVAVFNRFETVYVENVSSSGQVLRGGDPIEQAELNEGEEVQVGPFSLCWRRADSLSPEAAAPKNEGSSFAAESAPNEAESMIPANEGEAISADAPPSEGEVEGARTLMRPEGDVENPDSPGEDASFEVLAPDEKTRVSGPSMKAILKVVRGEVDGREIRLENGLAWFVGRSAKCHIQIDNQKMSRQHFKIIKIGNGFRVEDLGSANGTRVNGVAVTDSPLQPFDTIQAGPVEVQFLLASGDLQAGAVAALPAPTMLPSSEHIAASAPLDMDDGSQAAPGAQDRTMFAPPAVYTGQQGFAAGVAGSDIDAAALGAAAAAAAKPGSAPVEPKGLKPQIDRMVVWFKAQPKQKQILYGTASSVLLLLLIVLALPAKQPVGEVAVVAPPTEQLDKANAAQSPDISPEFGMLPQDKQNEIRELYAKAERAQAAKEWRTAFESARSILNVVKRYKNTVEIMDEAQTYLNEDSLGSISRSLSSVKDAARENGDQVKLLVESGKKALSEERWEDAAESFQKALNLDPTNKEAENGLAAASQRKKSVIVNIPEVVVKADPEAEAKQAERDEIDALKKQYQEARARMNEGKFRDGLPILKSLDQKLYDRLQDYNTGKRAPASIRDEMSRESMALQSRVKEGIDTIKTQMRADYQTQLADAEQFEANRQYVQAREIYDRIIRSEPAFDEALDARGRLYTKILAEARTVYQEGLIYEAVGDLDNAVEGFQKTRDLLTNVRDGMAVEYYKRASNKLKRLQR